ncbi:relaxase/mobilization nuclease domain-containing protein [Agrobacterium sp. SHOUNA12C]|nr:relaxase/mobilization nuclease domain-containing protein [Agrobacterium sp. BETTINA12B]MCJ9755141.1 relaxase/mobilization nuclease domain-containing protein [Agrobacterium sp. SHOUNA12C]
MFDVDAFLELLDDIERRKSQRVSSGFPSQQGVDMRGARKVRQKPGPKPKLRAAGGMPYTGSKPRTGAAPMDMRLDDEWRKRRKGGAGGSTSSARSLSQPDKTKQQPRPNTGTGTEGTKAEPRIRIAGPQERLAIAAGSQPAVVKLVSFAAGGVRVATLLTYQSRDGELAVERETGAQMAGGQWIQALADDWAEEDGRQPSKDVLRLSLSVRSDSDETIGAALKAALPGHRIAWVSRPTEAGEGRIVDVVMSAAARAHANQRKVQRIYDNRKSLAGLSARLEDAFGAGTGIEIHGFAHGVEGVGRYLSQVRKGTRHAVWSVRMDKSGSFVGDVVINAGSTSLAEAKDWKRDLRSQERRDVAHIIFSAKPGTAKEPFVDAARATLAREFAGHRYAFVLHEDRRHLHVHVAVKMLSETGQRLHPRIQDFKRWRQILAEEARERNIPMDAVSRFERANPPGYKLKDIHRVQRGIATDNARRRVEAVKNGAVHIPVREEGNRSAAAAAHGWGHVAGIAAQAVPEIAPEAGVLRLYRAERPGSRSSAPIFTRDRAEAAELAERYGGALSFIDVRPSEMDQIRPARSQSGIGGGDDRFVVARELADTMRLVPPAETTTATIMRFRRRSEIAARAIEQIAGGYQSPGYQAGRATKETDDMANLDVMKTSFAEMDEQMQVIRKNLPADRQPQIDELHGKLKRTQQDMLKVQETIEKRRGTVEGESFVQPIKHAFSQFVAEERGEVIRYVNRKENGRVGAIAFTDHGDKVEIARWKDRETVLAAMQVASQKWGSLTINGTDSYKAIAIELAAEHGFKVTNPELQDKLVAASERVARNKAGRAAIAPGVLPEGAKPETQTEVTRVTAPELAIPEKSSEPVIDGDKVRPADRDRGSMLAAMREAAKKWDTITINGSERDKVLAVELAAEHGFKISNPELQDKLTAAQEKVEQRRRQEQAREQKLTGFVDGSEVLQVSAKAEAEKLAAEQSMRETGVSPPAPVVDMGDKIKPGENDRESMLVAMHEAARKWDSITVNGSAKDKALAVELAAEHGFKISNPELQDKLAAARGKVDQRRQRELAREEKQTGFVDGSQALRETELNPADREGRETSSVSTTMRQGQLVAHGAAPYEHNPEHDASYYVTLARANGDQQTIWGVGLEREMRTHRPEIGEHITISYTGSEPVVVDGELKNRHNWQIGRPGSSDKITDNAIGRSNAEIAIALETVRERTDAEAEREVRQAERSAATNERPIDGGGEDHAYRTQAEANAAVRAERAVDQNPSRPIPDDVNQSPEIEHQRQIQQELLTEKQANRQVEVQKQAQKPRQSK